MSTTNHNILYFVRIPGISLLNTGIHLWKAQNTRTQRGDSALDLMLLGPLPLHIVD
jgi:hypothetical protein